MNLPSILQNNSQPTSPSLSETLELAAAADWLRLGSVVLAGLIVITTPFLIWRGVSVALLLSGWTLLVLALLALAFDRLGRMADRLLALEQQLTSLETQLRRPARMPTPAPRLTPPPVIASRPGVAVVQPAPAGTRARASGGRGLPFLSRG